MSVTEPNFREAPSGLAFLSSTVRFVLVLAGAAVITIALFLLMHALVRSDVVPPSEIDRPAVILAEYVPETEPTRRILPEAPAEVIPPPPIEALPVDPSDMPGVSPSANPVPVIDVEPDLDSMQRVLMPLPLRVRVPPPYPRRELALGIEGTCVVQYDILANGSTTNARTLECTSPAFARSALSAVAEWRHSSVDGELAETIVRSGVQTRFDFELDG